MESLRNRLREIGSPLAESAEAMDQLQRQLNSVLDDVEHLRGPATGSRAAHLSEEIGTTRANRGVHPVESAQAAVEMFQVLLPVVTEELGTLGTGDAAAETAALTLHRSIMRRVGLGALAYANYLLKKVSGAHRDERLRLARELHDGAAHSIGVALQNLELHQLYGDRDPALAGGKLALVREVLHEALDAVRRTAEGLHDTTAEYGNLENALLDYLDTHVPAGIDATACVTGDAAGLRDEVGEALYIVLREAVRNAVVHSGARSIRVNVDIDDNKVHATVEDDGDGFEVDSTLDSPSGIGLLSMRERVDLIAGELTVSSVDGEGTTVAIVVPEVGRLL